MITSFVKQLAIGAALACALLSAPAPALAEDVFIMPNAFVTRNTEPFSLALTESDHFPDLGHAPSNAPDHTKLSTGTDVWTASGATYYDRGNGHNAYSAWSFVVLDADEHAARYLFEPEGRGWVRLGATLHEGKAQLSGAEAQMFLDGLYLTPDERAAFTAPTDPFQVDYHRSASSYVCVRRCDRPGILTYRGSSISADPELGLRAFNVTVYMRGANHPAPDLPIELVTPTERRMLRTDANGHLVIPDGVFGPVMLSMSVRRPPVSDDANFTESVSTLTFDAPAVANDVNAH